MPKPDLKQRVIAKDYPEKTYTTTSFDEPKRKDVIQTEIPVATTRTYEENNDPRFPKKKPVEVVQGTVYHGTGSTDPNVVFGSRHSFIEKSGSKKAKKTNKKSKKTSKKTLKKNKKDIHEEVKKMRVGGLEHAKEAYTNSGIMLDSIVTGNGNKMILDAKTTNKSEQPDLRLYEENQYKHDRVEKMRRTPHGVKALHTLRRMN